MACGAAQQRDGAAWGVGRANTGVVWGAGAAVGVGGATGVVACSAGPESCRLGCCALQGRVQAAHGVNAAAGGGVAERCAATRYAAVLRCCGGVYEVRRVPPWLPLLLAQRRWQQARHVKGPKVVPRKGGGASAAGPRLRATGVVLRCCARSTTAARDVGGSTGVGLREVR